MLIPIKIVHFYNYSAPTLTICHIRPSKSTKNIAIL